MPRGVPVATVAINNSTNAGLLAVRILGAGQGWVAGNSLKLDEESSVEGNHLMARVLEYKEDMQHEVMAKIERLNQVGWENY